MNGEPDGVVLMVGPGLATPGGMTAVVRSYRDSGLFERAGVRYVSTYEGRAPYLQLKVVAKALWQMTTLLWRGRLRLLHVHCAARGSFWRKSLLCAVARLAGVPYLFHLHSGEFPNWYEGRPAWVRGWVRTTMRHAAKVLCLSPGWVELVRVIEPRARVGVLHNPVSVPDALPPLRRTGNTVLFMGRLRAKKGVFDLLQAAAEVRAAVPDLAVVLAGDEGEALVRARAEALGLAPAVSLPGWVDGTRKAALLARADVCVLPSYFEGLPIGLLEAMAVGVPVVATPVGGIPDLIAEGQDGLLVPVGRPDKLAAAIQRLLLEPDLRERIRSQAFHKVREHYAMPVVARQLEALYRQAAAGRGTAGCAT
jgi:glycosyltransferase involved in cell wall biosynthesis